MAWDVLVQIKGAFIILDIDGTLLAAGQDSVPDLQQRVVAELSYNNTVVLVSNGRNETRKQAISESLGLRLLVSKSKKPDQRLAIELNLPKDKEIIVVGDRWITDGVFARVTGARFIKVTRITNRSDSLYDKILYAVDDVLPLPKLMMRIVDVSRLLRVHQYVKNFLIFAPVFFAGQITEMLPFMGAFRAFIAFSLAASVGYIVNDSLDRAEDAQHPIKRFRPIATGSVTPRMGVFIALLALAGSIALAPSMLVRAVIMAYLLLSIAYSTKLKRIPYLELIVFSLFYGARIIVGGLAARVYVSPWLIVITLSVALLMIIGKRHAELRAGRKRGVLRAYHEKLLYQLFTATVVWVVIVYLLYTIFGTSLRLALITNIPVMLAMLRYHHLAFLGVELEFPEKAILNDKGLLFAIFIWISLMTYAFY